MAYSTLPIVNPGDNISSASWGNVTRDNFSYLFSGRPAVWSVYTASSFSTTSTSFVDVSNANLKITATITSGRIFGFFTTRPNYSYTTAGGTWTCYLRTMLDGTTIDNSQQSFVLSGQLLQSMIIPFFYSGLSIGSHYVTLQWMLSGSGGAGYTAWAYAPVTMYLAEV